MKRKLTSCLLSLIMISSLFTPVFALDSNKGTNEKAKEDKIVVESTEKSMKYESIDKLDDYDSFLKAEKYEEKAFTAFTIKAEKEKLDYKITIVDKKVDKEKLNLYRVISKDGKIKNLEKIETEIKDGVIEVKESKPDTFLITESEKTVTANTITPKSSPVEEMAHKVFKTPILRSANGAQNEIKIKTFTSELVSGYNKAPNIWVANFNKSGKTFVYRVNFSLSGIGYVEPNAIDITVPKSVLYNRNGKAADTIDLGIPSKDELTGVDLNEISDSVQFAYYVDGDKVHIYNIREIPAGSNSYIEVGYKTSENATSYVSGQSQKPFNTTINLKQEGTNDTATSSATPVILKTEAHITSNSIKPTYDPLYHEWQSDWGPKPADADNYYYVVWSVQSNVPGAYENVTQPYDFTLTSRVTSTLPSGAEPYLYKFEGASWGKSNIIKNQYIGCVRYDMLLSRIKKSEADKVNYWKITNTATSTVTSIDDKQTTKAVSSAYFDWHVPVFQYPYGHVYNEKQGDGFFRAHKWVNEYAGHEGSKYSRYDLQVLKEQPVGTTKLNNIDFGIETRGWIYPWSLYDGANTKDPNNYGKAPVKFVMTDGTIQLADSEGKKSGLKLTHEDYQLDSLRIDVKVKNAVFNDFEQKFNISDNTTFTDKDIVLVKVGTDDGEYKTVAQYNVKTYSFTNVDYNYIKKLSSVGEIIFKDNITKFSLGSPNILNHYYYAIDSNPNYSLKNSQKVVDYIKDKQSISIFNESTGHFYKYTGSKFATITTSDYDYLRETEFNSEIKKEVVSATNSKLKGQYYVGWEVNLEENYIFGEGTKDIKPQKGGVIYDLLPPGSSLEKNSLVLYNNNNTEITDYDYKLTNNFRDSGRTMLEITINEDIEHLTAYYRTVHSYDSLIDFNKKIYNPVAFKTGNSKITDGRPDDGGDLSNEVHKYYVGLDKQSKGNKFIYSQDKLDVEFLIASVSGLTKKVKAETAKIYSKKTTVGPNETYNYRWRYKNTPGTMSKDLIFFDSIENYKTLNGKTSEWKGALETINVGQLRQMGVKPVVYVSTEENYDLSKHELDKPDTILKGWTKLSDFKGEYKDIKAVAIDCRKDTKGDNFILGDGKSLSVELTFRAPTSLPDGVTHDYPKTYNNIYIYNTIIPAKGGDAKSFFIHQDFTTVDYIVKRDINIQKISAENENEKIKDIEFNIFGKSDYNHTINEFAVTNKDGVAHFDGIEKGTYTLRESKSTPDWQLSHTEYKVVIDKNGKLFIDDKEYTNKDRLTVKNLPRIHNDIKFNKISIDEEDLKWGIPDTTFRLYGRSNYFNDINKFATSSKSGTVHFDDVEEGEYTLVETKANDRYILSEKEYKVVVDQNANVAIYNDSGEEIREIENKPRYLDLRVKKIDSEFSFGVEGAEFRLKGTSDSGVDVDRTEVSKGRGFAIFKNVEVGLYTLEETKAPAKVTSEGKPGGNISYERDQKKYIVEVKKDGTIEVDGRKKDKDGGIGIYFEFPNKKALSGEIVVEKIWDDGGDVANRINPTIKIATWQAPYVEDSYKLGNVIKASSVKTKPEGYVDIRFFPSKGSVIYEYDKISLTDDPFREKEKDKISKTCYDKGREFGCIYYYVKKDTVVDFPPPRYTMHKYYADQDILGWGRNICCVISKNHRLPKFIWR